MLNPTNKKLLLLYSILLSYIATTGLIYYMTGSITSANIPTELLIILVTPIMYGSICRFISNKYIPYTEGIFALLISIIFFIGKSVYETHTLEYFTTGIFRLFFGIIGGFILFLILFDYLYRFISIAKDYLSNNSHTQISNKQLLFMALIMFAVYLLVYLIYYPGIFSYDSTSQTKQALGMEIWDTHHPVLHTFIWMLCIKAGKLTGIEGLIIYSIGSICIVVTTSITVIKSLVKNNIPEIICLCCYLYYLLVPTLQIFSFICTKDIFFSCCMLLFIVNLRQAIINTPPKSHIIKVFIWGFLSVLLRNNMIYVVLVMSVLAIIFYLLKQNNISNRSITLSLLLIVVMGMLISKLLYPAIGITSNDTFKETIPVPVNQIACVYVNEFDNLSEEQKVLIRNYLPYVERYNPRFADKVKFDFDLNYYYEQPDRFWNLYFDLLKKYPMRYVSSFIELNIVYWYPFADFPDEFANRNYIETCIWEADYYPLERESLFPALLDKYEEIANFEAEWMRLPLLYQYFSLSFPFITMYVCLFICVKNKRTDMILILGGFILLFLTYLLGPVSNYRYVYTFYLAMPYYITSSIFKNKPNEHEI